MNKRKFLITISLILIGIILAGTVCASSQTLELDGVKFNIPNGYTEITKYATNDEVEQGSSISVVSSHRAYSDNNNYLGITVDEYSNHPSLSSLRLDDEVFKEIGGVRGLYAFDELHFFTYEEGDKIVMISADDYSIIEEVMGK